MVQRDKLNASFAKVFTYLLYDINREVFSWSQAKLRLTENEEKNAATLNFQ